MTVDVRIQVQGLGVLVTLETVVVIPQYRVREVGSAWKMWMCHSRQDVGEDCHPGYCGHVSPHSGSGTMVPVETANLTPGVVSVREGYPGDCGSVTQALGPQLWGHPEVCECVTTGSVSWEVSPWRL